MSQDMSWVDKQEESFKKEKAEGYFSVEEGDNRAQLLTHCAQLAQVWTGSTYRPAVEGDKNVSVKGVCWVLQDGKIKQAKLAYSVVKAIRELQNDPDYAFTEFPMPRMVNIKAKNAGTKEVTYTVIPAPKETPISKEVMAELKKKPTPEEIVEKIKERAGGQKSSVDTSDAPNPEDIPF